MKMPQADKEKVLKALRSGEYKQGEGFLGTVINSLGEFERAVNRVPTHFCCLGVAQMVISRSIETLSKSGGSCAFPTTEWCNKHGWEDTGNFDVFPEFTSRDREYDGIGLMSCNDHLHLTFSQIADLWEYFVEGTP